uniref:Cytochrome oxidase assembly protein n=1 Tax=Peronospora matthiolae TaxID=2874970 RepID=A0AAV1TF21_9STRA
MTATLFLRGHGVSALKSRMTVSKKALRWQLGPGQTRYSASWTSEMLKRSKSSLIESPLPWWLFGTAGLVATTLTVGAAARLTRTGASTLYWKPHFLHLPQSEDDWHKEFNVYRDFCSRSQRTPMTLEDFKRNYKWEAAHRKLGQVTALSFLGPLAYFAMKKKLPVPAQAPLALIAGLGAVQLYVGRAMVEHNVRGSGQHDQDATFDGATFFLPIHSALSLANFSLLVWTGLGIVSPISRAISVRGLMTPGVLQELGQVRKHFVALTGLAAATIFAGSLVAEIDGGREFQTFPKMGDRWIPHGLFDQKPWLRNFHDNVALVQLDHRLLALGTLAAYTTVFVKARKARIWSNLPEDAKRAIMVTMAAVGGQVAMGATMLVNEVPTPLAMVHQSGAALVLGSSLWVLHALRFARPGGLMGAAVATAAAKMA